MIKRVLHIVYSMGMGGVENFIMNVYRSIDREKIQFDFILQTEEESYFEKEIISLGGKIYRIPRFEKHPLEHIKKLKKILVENNYEVIHRHTASSVVFVDLLVAKTVGVKTRIVHSHSSSNRFKLLNKIFRPFLYHNATKRLACGVDAGKWLYGNRKFDIINNALNCKKYYFDEEIRNKYKKDLGLENNTVIGHVGRFDKVKNHDYLIKVFERILKENENYRLVLCGKGTLENEIHKLCEDYKISDKVLFLGNRDDINNVLQAVDIFAFPSIYEGLGIVLIEAQLTNIPCVVSNKIPKEAIYNENIKKLDIGESDIDKWVNEILNIKLDLTSRKVPNQCIIEEYNIDSVTKNLCNIYEG